MCYGIWDSPDWQMDQYDRHMSCNQLIFGTDQDELTGIMGMVWLNEKGDRIHYIFCTFFFKYGHKLPDLHLLFHYKGPKWKLEEFVSLRIHTGLQLLLRIYLQQHKHGHLPYVPAEIFITDAPGSMWLSLIL